MTNEHEELARALKASAISDLLILAWPDFDAETRDGCASPADWAEALLGTDDDDDDTRESKRNTRDTVARLAGQRPPSERTWRQVVARLRLGDTTDSLLRRFGIDG